MYYATSSVNTSHYLLLVERQQVSETLSSCSEMTWLLLREHGQKSVEVHYLHNWAPLINKLLRMARWTHTVTKWTSLSLQSNRRTFKYIALPYNTCTRACLILRLSPVLLQTIQENTISCGTQDCISYEITRDYLTSSQGLTFFYDDNELSSAAFGISLIIAFRNPASFY